MSPNQHQSQAPELIRSPLFCYECMQPCAWLAPDGRCACCTRCTPEQVTGERAQ